MNKGRSVRLLKWLGFVLLSGAGLAGCTKNPKAQFQPCKTQLQWRDIVFVIDQSKTMYENDSLAVRWEVLLRIAEGVLNDEKLLSGKLADTVRTRIAVIPFGGARATGIYNEKLRWFTRDSLNALGLFLQEMKQQSQNRRNLSRYSDFGSAFSLLPRLPWRDDAPRYIFFISDGKYDLDDSSPLNDEEIRKLRALFASLRQHRSQSSFYFIGFGKPGYDRHHEPNVHIELLDSLANASPLSKLSSSGLQQPTFSAPGLIRSNLVTIISENLVDNRRRLHEQLEQILRWVRFAQPEKHDNGLSIFPVVDPGYVEIQVEVDHEITTTELAGKLRIFVQTQKGRSYSSLRPLNPMSWLLPTHLHAFAVDTAGLRRQFPEARVFASLKSWGMESLDPAIALKRVSLVIKDNWLVRVDRCDIIPASKSRTWWRRLLHLREPPEFNLQIEMRAMHPCGGTLPQARLRVEVQDSGQWTTIATKTTPSKPETNESIYIWRLEIPHQKIFEKRIGWPVNIDVIIEDLYACKLGLSAEVPINGQPALSRFTLGANQNEKPKI